MGDAKDSPNDASDLATGATVTAPAGSDNPPTVDLPPVDSDFGGPPSDWQPPSGFLPRDSVEAQEANPSGVGQPPVEPATATFQHAPVPTHKLRRQPLPNISHKTVPVEPGEVFLGKYKIERFLGRGGMGVVMAAYHEALDQHVAIKFLIAGGLQELARARFEREARAAAKIKNEHCARIFDVGTLEDGTAYMIMEYLEGSDLSNVLQREGKLSVANTVDYVLQALDALADGHAVGIVHRDLKPSNLFLTTRADGVPLVKVLDFGIAKHESTKGDGKAGVLTGDSIMGTPRYMSPEQLRSTKSADRRSDIWSLGIILYELLTGDTPFDGQTNSEIFAAVLQDELPPLSGRRPEVPPALEAVVNRCLARDREARYQDMAELARALAPFAPPRSRAIVDRFMGRLAATAPSVRPPSSSVAGAASGRETGGAWIVSDTERRRRSFSTRIAMGALAVALLGGGWFAYTRLSGSKDRQPPPTTNAATSAATTTTSLTTPKLEATAAATKVDTSATATTTAAATATPPTTTTTGAAANMAAIKAPAIKTSTTKAMPSAAPSAAVPPPVVPSAAPPPKKKDPMEAWE